MDWTKFNNHGESPNHAFEVMCNILFNCWLKKEYKDNIDSESWPEGEDVPITYDELKKYKEKNK